MHKRVAIAFFTMIAVFGLLVVNIGLIVIDNEISPSSQSTNTRSIILSTSRGMIYDCNMKRLVNNSSRYLTVCLPTTQAFNLISQSVSDEEKNQIYENITSGKASILTTSQIYNEPHLKSIEVTDRYSHNQLCVHLVGHLDENGEGVMGLEKAYNSYLSQQSGELRAVWGVDALNHILYGEGVTTQSKSYLSPAGIQLTIDSDIQKIAEDVLAEFEIDKGAAVVMDSETAEILACASVPEFDPLDLSSSLNDDNSPFLNRATTPYSVGSVFKPFVATTAVENHIDFTHICTGSIEVNGTTFNCSDSTAHGEVNMQTAMQVSCNTYFIALGQIIGSEQLLSLCSDFGLGKSTELADNMYLKSGKLPNKDSITSPQALANLCFGQGELLISPVQMAAAYCVFANGGYYREPTLMKGIADKNGNIIQKVKLPEACRIISESTAEKLDSILESVVADGNGKKAYSEFCDCHGKTATAQSGWYENGVEINHTWFCGYFTVNNKKYVAVIFKEDGISGSVDCAPIFKELAERVSKKSDAV